jgi:two-component system, chemotaxis family, protein-glutamate methylesterase/glutaminase
VTLAPRLIVIGASAGGVNAIQTLLKGLPSKYSIPIIIVQHLPPTARQNLSQIYSGPSGCTLVEVEDKMPVEPWTVYFSTPNYHVEVADDLTISLSQDDLVQHARPSIDVLFHSAARVLGLRSMGILLTGASQDGADGLKKIADAGGLTIVQSPEDADHDTMPSAALAIMTPTKVLSLEGIAEYLSGFARQDEVRT